MANIIIGRNGSIGPPAVLNSDAPHPHWNTMTTMPYAAPIDSMFMITALSGTSSERNTIISNRNDSDSTAMKKIGSRWAR